MIVIKINKCPFSLLIAISITKESPSKPRPWQAKARISKIESLFSCLLVPLHCTRSRNTRSLLQNLIRSTKGPGKARFYLKPLVEVNQAISSLVVQTRRTDNVRSVMTCHFERQIITDKEFS